MATKKSAKLVKSNKSNVPMISFESTVDDAMEVGKVGGKAGASQIIALFNGVNGYWAPRVVKGERVEPLTNYFRVKGKQKNGTPSERTILQDKFLSDNNPRYKKRCEDLAKYSALLKEAVTNKNRESILEYEALIEKEETPIKSARSMFHRSMTALYHLYNAKAIKVGFDRHLKIRVECPVNPDGSKNGLTGAYNAAQLTAKGQVDLGKVPGLIEKRKARAGKNGKAGATTVITPPAVDAMTAKKLMGDLGELFASDKFNPPTTVSPNDPRAPITPDKMAMLEMVTKAVDNFSQVDIKDEKFKAGVSKLVLHLLHVLKAKPTAKDVQNIVKFAA